MSGGYWDPFGPEWGAEPLRFPAAEPVAVVETPAFVLVGEPVAAEMLAGFGAPVGVLDEAVEGQGEFAFEPAEDFAAVTARPVADFKAMAADAAMAWQDAPIYLPGERPPTLAEITAPRVRVWRGVGLALGLHVAVLGTALWIMRGRVPAPAPDGPVVALVMEAPPQGDVAKPAPLTVTPAPKMPAPARRDPVPVAPPPAPVVAKGADLPLPVPLPPMRPAPAAPAPAVAAAPVQGVKAQVPRAGSELVMVDRPAAPRADNAPPYYPPVARSFGEEGEVDLSVEVLANGLVGRVVVARSCGYPRLDEAARRSLLGWRFQPAVRGGVAVGSVFTYYVRYQLH